MSRSKRLETPLRGFGALIASRAVRNSVEAHEFAPYT